MSGFGEAGLRGEPSGDLIVNVRVADHERFKRNGDDLYLVSDIRLRRLRSAARLRSRALCPTRSLETVPRRRPVRRHRERQ